MVKLAQFIRDNDVGELDAQSAFGPERTRKILAALRDKLESPAIEVLPIDDRIAIELNVGEDQQPNFKGTVEATSALCSRNPKNLWIGCWIWRRSPARAGCGR